MTGGFWDQLEHLLIDNRLVIDRPKGSGHPRIPDLIYPLDYGYLQETTSADGGGIDVWVGSLPSQHLTGIVCTYDSMKKDAEIKLLVSCSDDDIQSIMNFHSDGMKAIFIPRPGQRS